MDYLNIEGGRGLNKVRALPGFLITTLIPVLVARPAFASHMSGGENDLMAAYGGAALVIGFVGLLGMLGLVPRRWRGVGLRWGKWLVAAGMATLAAGGYHVSSLGSAEEFLGDMAFGRMAAQQLMGTVAVFGFFTGAAYYLGKRSGLLDMGEGVKYSVFRNGDPADRTATRVAQPREQRLMYIPLAAMGVLALFFTAGVLVALSRVSK